MAIGLLAALPALLRSVPSRYIVYATEKLPQPLQDPIQQIALPVQEAAILPTAVPVANVAALLGKPTPETEIVTAVSPTDLPLTFTPLPNTDLPVTLTPLPTAVPPTNTPTPIPSPTPELSPLPAAVRLTGFYHQFQEWNNCGPATLAMTMSYFNLPLTQSDTARILKPNPEDRNVSPHEMADFVQNETVFEAIFRANGNAETVKRLLANGIPVILEIGIEPPGEFRWMGWYGHYMLVVAYDDAQQQFWVYDSWLGTGGEPLSSADPNGRSLSYADLERDWPHFNRNYIAIYKPEQTQLAADIIGAGMNDDIMWQQAIAQAQEDARRDPDNPFYWFNLGTSLNEVGSYDTAVQAFDQARAIGLPWRMLWYQFGPYEAYYENGRYEDVILLADTTLNGRPYFEESFYYKGLAQAALGDLNAAYGNIQRAADFNPYYTPALDALNQFDNGG
ncbi:MAG: hypothetical protein GY796_14470 [Chloroflexi bacterium]|nr:hypothetical protein [Chloroflexota bacterium]